MLFLDGKKGNLYMISLLRCYCTTNKELDLSNTFLIIVMYRPPTYSFILHIRETASDYELM